MIEVLCVGGTGETSNSDSRTQVTGMLSELLRFLPADEFRGVWVTYPGAYAFPVTYAESVSVGAANLVRAVSASQNKVIVVGYSQGAEIVKRAMNEVLHKTPFLAEKIVGIGLVADPSRPADQRTGWPAPPELNSTYGIAGETHIDLADLLHIPVWTIVAPTDPITDLPPGNPLRSIFDLTEFASLDAEVWAHALWERAKKRQWQRWWSIENWQTWGGAIAYLRGYLIDGRHTQDYIRGGHLERLATIMRTMSVKAK